MNASLSALSKWLAATPASQFIQAESWVIPTTQTLHILAIAVVLSSIGMVSLRVLGWAGARTTLADTARRYIPWVWSALVVLLLTGAVLIVGEPGRELNNPAFQAKMVLVLVLIALAAAFRLAAVKPAAAGDVAAAPTPAGARVIALSSLAVALVVAVLGRWIAYAITEQ